MSFWPSVRAMMSGITALNQAGAPIKDFSKYVNVNQAAEEEKLNGTMVERWGDVEARLGGLLASVETVADFEKRLRVLARYVQSQMAEDATASQFLLFNRAVSHFSGYSVLHSLLCGSLCYSLAEVFALTPTERGSLVCAALTMNIGMTQLQDLLALQKHAPSAHQRDVIDNHASIGTQMLLDAGVTDPVWLEIVSKHHAPLEGPEALADWSPALRMTKILQTVDRYTAAMSPRKSRAGRTARDSVRSVVVQAGAAKHDEVGTALMRLLGLSPPGTYVKLSNGETAVVLRHGAKPAEPIVASVLNNQDQPIAVPRLHDTERGNLKIKSTLTAASVRVNLKLDAMLRLIPR